MGIVVHKFLCNVFAFVGIIRWFIERKCIDFAKNVSKTENSHKQPLLTLPAKRHHNGLSIEMRLTNENRTFETEKSQRDSIFVASIRRLNFRHTL